MDIALAKRRENIAEYILYLWQIEDLLRALQFSPEAIYSQLIAPRGIEEGQRHNSCSGTWTSPTCCAKRAKRKRDT